MVEPPSAAATATAFSIEARLTISAGTIPWATARTSASAAARMMAERAGSAAGGDAMPGTVRPSASPTAAMVLAENMPAQVPTPGHAAISTARSRTASIWPLA